MSVLKKLAVTAISLAAAACFAVGASGYTSSTVITASAQSVVTLGSTSIKKATIKLSSTSVTYTGKAIKPTVKVTYDGKTLKKGTDYKLTYSSNTKIGTAKVKVTGLGSYSGSKTLTFKIIPKKVTGFTATSTQTTVTLSWDKVANCTGYRIYRYNSSTKKWVKVKTIKSKTTTTWTDKCLLGSKTYKYRIKAYKKVDGTNYWGKSVQVNKKTSTATTPVAKNGELTVSGANIVNEKGKKFQIIGMSTHGIMWEDYSDILSKSSLKTLRDDWGVNTIRIAMYTEEWGGYTTGSTYAAQAKKKVNTGIKNATSLGMYVIIDWHILSDGNPQTHQSEAISFFKYMAKKYKNYNNILYEICNEPNGSVTWSSNIKPYAKKVISAIRKYDDDAIIICGTGTWSQDIDDVVNDRLSDKNTVYALHFYANTHTDWLRTRFSECYSSGLPILVSEFGTCNSSGSGGYNSSQTKTWLKLLDSKKVGYVNWSACDKDETCSAFVSGTDLSAIKKGTSQLTSSGKLIRSWYRKRAGLS
ncbi:MAG: glycoside hydrolase family 5 protein [Ruminococcus sp.]|nr:glycoside hydrolase family 5 protein [Ruminococcus sp.]